MLIILNMNTMNAINILLNTMKKSVIFNSNVLNIIIDTY